MYEYPVVAQGHTHQTEIQLVVLIQKLLRDYKTY